MKFFAAIRRHPEIVVYSFVVASLFAALSGRYVNAGIHLLTASIFALNIYLRNRFLRIRP